jgi:nucleotide-binding universal stress UspA family protein
MKKILLTTDFSDNAEQAIEYAMHLFKYDDCQFYVLHVLKSSTFISDDLMSMQPSSNLYEQLISSAKLKLENYIKDITSKHNNILHKFIPIVDYDNLVAAIKQVAEKQSIELVVMGTKGASNKVRRLFGTNTIHVIQGCTLPVLAIPDKYMFKPIEKVIFTSNYEMEYTYTELKALVDLVEHHDYKIDILHLSETNMLSPEQEAVKTSLQNCFKNATHRFIELETEGFLKIITQFIKSNNIDLYAMVNRKHAFWERLFTEQKIEKVAYNMTIPFLVM